MWGKLLQYAAQYVGSKAVEDSGTKKGKKPIPSPHAAADKLNAWGWAFQNADAAGHRLWSGVSENFPTFQHIISVSCIGGPESDLRRTWYLCLSAAFGRFRNRAPGVQSVSLEGTWDVTGKACSVTIAYQNNGLIDVSNRIGQGVGLGKNPSSHLSGLEVIQRGPDQLTVGGTWPSWMFTVAQGGLTGPGGIISFMGGGLISGALIASTVDAATEGNGASQKPLVPSVANDAATEWKTEMICNESTPILYAPFVAWTNRPVSVFKYTPSANGDLIYLPWHRVLPKDAPQNQTVESYSVTSSASGVPVLPDDGRVITSGEKYDPRHQNPRPAVDGISRGALMDLVAASLSAPCYLPCSPPCGLQPLAARGRRVYAPGSSTEPLPYNLGGFMSLVDTAQKTIYTSQGLQVLANFFNTFNIGAPDGYNTPHDYNAETNLRKVCR